MTASSHAFRGAVERRDHAAMVATLADDVVLWSPLSFRPFEGRDSVARLLEVLLNEVFVDFRYTDELHSDDGTHGLIFRARVGEREVQGLDLLRCNDDGLISDFTVMVRPASGLEALGAAVGPRYGYITTGR